MFTVSWLSPLTRNTHRKVMMASPIMIGERLSDSEEGSCGSGSGHDSPSLSPNTAIKTSFFGQTETGKKRVKKVS